MYRCTERALYSLLGHAGSLECGESSITISYPDGHYCLKLFDHIRVRVGVEQPHSHAHSFVLHLLICGAVAPALEEGSGGRREVVQVRQLCGWCQGVRVVIPTDSES